MPAPKPSPASGDAAVSQPRTWTFLTNHGHVLVYLSGNPDARVRDVANAVGITERSAHSILSELEADSYLTKIKVGRQNHYQLDPQPALRHPVESSHSIGELLRVFGGP